MIYPCVIKFFNKLLTILSSCSVLKKIYLLISTSSKISFKLLLLITIFCCCSFCISSFILSTSLFCLFCISLFLSSYDRTGLTCFSISEKLKENSKKELDEKMASLQEEFRKKELEYQKQQEQLKKSLDDAKRKAEQGSQQIQWDISENDLKDALIHAFPIDSIEDVATWVKWADLIHLVKNNFWQVVWTIVWESKNTKSWSESWVMKLKEDTLKVWWNVSILVTAVLPKDIKNFWIYDDIMVCTPEFAVSVAAILRDKILSISKVEKSLEWKDLKMELLYKYLTSQEFSSKINMMIQVFANLKAWIDSERRAMEKNWKKREKDLERATFAITWMYWELESLMWQALPWAEILELGSWEDEYFD